jgi:hypothetical protein
MLKNILKIGKNEDIWKQVAILGQAGGSPEDLNIRD